MTNVTSQMRFMFVCLQEAVTWLGAKQIIPTVNCSSAADAARMVAALRAVDMEE
jgi:hypothetical protein